MKTDRMWNIRTRSAAALALLVTLSVAVHAQLAPEAETASMKLGHFWIGVTANGWKGTFDYFSGFFPNDYGVMANRGQYAEAFAGAGFTFAATNWYDAIDTLHPVAVYGPVVSAGPGVPVPMPNGKVVVPIKSSVRYPFPQQTIDFAPVQLTYPGTVDPAQLAGGTYDQLVEVTTEHIFGVQTHRRIMVWTQQFNDNYVIVDAELTNASADTLHNFYVNMMEGNSNMQLSSVRTPYPPINEVPVLPMTWMHYYGGRVGDSMRVFYEYSADNPDIAGDNMGAPAVSQGGRLLYPLISYWAVLHASREPYTDPSADVDDFLQPTVTYIGTSTKFPYSSQDDEYGNKNYWVLRGGFSDLYPMDTVHAWPGTHHGLNNDELGVPDFSNYIAGTKQGNDQKRWMSFGPYTFPPNTKIRIVYASGVSGIGLPAARDVGQRWQNGTLENPPNMPDPDKGWLPANFAFPTGATEMDKRKDRWLSMGIDSVMHSAWRAKWNFDHGYNIPQAPPPPQEFSVTGHSDGVVIAWKDAGAEALSDFEGYRIMRRTGNLDTSTYHAVYESGPADRAISHTFKDTSIVAGAQYYYYVQAKRLVSPTDANADPDTRGAVLFSSRTLVPDVTKVNPSIPPQDDLSKIRVVPNPYNIRDEKIHSVYGWTDDRGLLFMNLPAQVTIRIFTENGDLVKTIVHAPAIRKGSVFWDMITDSQQVINSGVYIAVFETPTGGVSYEKFVVVR